MFEVQLLSNDIKYVSVLYSENQYCQIYDIPNFKSDNGKITEKMVDLYEDWSQIDSVNLLN
jgi:hypothetical protein